ncbi:hypothetical protein M0Q50_05390 [bacterium]|jgi:hypothetical protein|nr:hypothetical protein [bacterium]
MKYIKENNELYLDYNFVADLHVGELEVRFDFIKENEGVFYFYKTDLMYYENEYKIYINDSIFFNIDAVDSLKPHMQKYCNSKNKTLYWLDDEDKKSIEFLFK